MKLNMQKMVKSCAIVLRQKLPQILVYGGCVGVVIGGVKACCDSMAMPELLDDHKERVEKVHKNHQDEPDSKEEKRELVTAYATTGAEIVKLYAVSVSIEAVSIISILAGNNVLRKRNLALAAACSEITASFNTYRGKVVEKYGQAADDELRFGITQAKIEETVVDEDGKTKKVKKTVDVMNGLPSDYARYFAHGEARGWEQNDNYNELFLKGQQNAANHILYTNKILFLNDIYDMLGIDRSISGQAVGWIMDEDSEESDCHVDLRFRKVYRESADAENGYESVWLIDPNVDGPILDRAIRKGLIEK